MRPYLAIVGTRFRTLLQYRSAAVANVFTQTFFGLVRIMVLEGFYRSSAATPPLTFDQMVGYVWVGQATLAMFAWNVDADIRNVVRDGTVAYELCRPLDLYALWFSRALAWRTAPMLMRFVPMVVVASVLLPLLGFPEWQLRAPPSLAAGALWGATMLGALLLSCALTTLMHVTLLWTVNGAGTVAIISTLAAIFGGMVIPLPLFPDWARPLMEALPFAGAMDLPCRVFIGNISLAQGGGVLLHQLGWTLALVALGRALMRTGLRRLEGAGG
jgi:ABC-2 type transport system permease protein